MVFDATKNKPSLVANVDLSAFGTAPRAMGSPTTEIRTIQMRRFCALFFAQLRPGKTAQNETEDNEREGHVVAISAATNSLSVRSQHCSRS